MGLIGARVYPRNGYSHDQGTVVKVEYPHLIKVRWDDGGSYWHPADSLRRVA